MPLMVLLSSKLLLLLQLFLQDGHAGSLPLKSHFLCLLHLTAQFSSLCVPCIISIFLSSMSRFLWNVLLGGHQAGRREWATRRSNCSCYLLYSKLLSSQDFHFCIKSFLEVQLNPLPLLLFLDLLIPGGDMQYLWCGENALDGYPSYWLSIPKPG